MKILINGPSVSLGPISWPVQLSVRPDIKQDIEIVNFSRIGCGNNYIQQSTIAELSQRKYDLVIISWTYFFRRDFRSRAPTALLHGLELEDPHLLNNPYLDKFWFFEKTPEYVHLLDSTHGFNLKNYLEAGRFYNMLYTNEYRLEETLLNIISLQSVLKSLNIPYLFTFYKPLLHLKKFQHLHNLIDYNNVHRIHLFHLAKRHHQIINNHPDLPAHNDYLNTILEHPNIKNLIKP